MKPSIYMFKRMLNNLISHLLLWVFEKHPYAQWYLSWTNSLEKLIEMYRRKKLKPNWIDNQSVWLLYLAGNRSSRLVQIFYAFCYEIPLSVCLCVCPPPSCVQVSMPLHCHHGDTWPVTSLCCSSVLVSFFNFTLSFSLLCLADYEWIKQCVNL